MLKIKVKHEIGDIVKNKFNENKYRIIWYDYVDSRWVQYVCQQMTKDEWVYLLETEIEWWKEKNIWFTL